MFCTHDYIQNIQQNIYVAQLKSNITQEHFTVMLQLKVKHNIIDIYIRKERKHDLQRKQIILQALK